LKSEGEALTLLNSFPLSRHTYLEIARARGTDPAAVYAEVWSAKGFVARVYEQKQQAARLRPTRLPRNS